MANSATDRTPLPSTLDEVLGDIHTRLSRGVHDRRHAFHLAALASLSANGPQVRHVVLRAYEPEIPALRSHTDLRSAKIAELRADPRASMAFYGDPIQLRASGLIEIHHDDALADQAWATTRLMSRRCYLVSPAPGTALEQPGNGLPDALAERSPDELESAAGRANFAVLRLHVQRIDWLYLGSRGHLRAQFTYRGGWRGRFTVP